MPHNVEVIKFRCWSGSECETTISFWLLLNTGRYAFYDIMSLTEAGVTLQRPQPPQGDNIKALVDRVCALWVLLSYLSRNFCDFCQISWTHAPCTPRGSSSWRRQLNLKLRRWLTAMSPKPRMLVVKGGWRENVMLIWWCSKGAVLDENLGPVPLFVWTSLALRHQIKYWGWPTFYRLPLAAP